MAKVGCLQEVSLCLQQENSENISKIFSNLTYELHSKQFKFLDLAELLNKGVCRYVMLLNGVSQKSLEETLFHSGKIFFFV